jgi:hypothetical protein
LEAGSTNTFNIHDPRTLFGTLINALQTAEHLAKDANTEGEMQEAGDEHKHNLGLGNKGKTRKKIRRAMMTTVMTRSSRPVPENMPGETRDIEVGMQETNISTIKQIPQPETEDENDDGDEEAETGETDKRLAQHSQVLTRVINRWTRIPIPSNKDWKATMAADPYTKYIYETLDNRRWLNYGKLDNKRYYKEGAEGKWKQRTACYTNGRNRRLRD